MKSWAPDKEGVGKGVISDSYSHFLLLPLIPGTNR